MRDTDADAAGEHHETAAKAVDEEHGEHGEDEVNGAGDHDVEEYIVGSVAGAAIDLGSIVEENVDASPLLQRSKGDAHKQDLPEGGEQKLAPRELGRLG